MTNRDVVAALLERLGKPWSLVRSVPDRPGHDRRYALDGSKLAALGWRNRTSFADGLAATVDWFRANEAWWRAAKSGDWDAYYERQYGARLAGLDRGLTDAGRRHRGGRPARPGADRRPRGGAVHRPVRADRVDAGRSSTSTRPDAFGALLDRDRPEVVVHAAAWTDVDGCAREPELAMARNGTATAAPRPGDRGAGDRPGRRLDERGLRRSPDRRRGLRPGRRARARSTRMARRSWPARTARPRGLCERHGRRDRRSGSSGRRGCSGRPATTFRRRSSPPRSGHARPASRSGSSPTRSARRRAAHDLAEGIAELIGAGGDRAAPITSSTAARASRAEWAREVLRQAGIERRRPRTSRRRRGRGRRRRPAWAVLEPTPLPGGEPLRPWPAALADRVPGLLRDRSRPAAAGR